MKEVEAKAAAKKYKEVVKKAKADSKAELAKLKMQMTAKEAASKHIAVFGPLYLLLLVGGFLAGISYIPPDHVSVVVGLLTLLVTMIGSNLRSIVSESVVGDKKPTSGD